MSTENSFAQFVRLANQLNEEGVQRSLLLAQLMPQPKRKPCAEIDIPLRDENNPEANRENFQIAETGFKFKLDINCNSLALSQEAIDCINQQLKRDAMQRFERLLHQLCMPLGGLSFTQRRLSADAEQCVASTARSLNISTEEAFELCDRFLSRHNMSWEVLSQFIANGLVRQNDGELALVVQIANPLMLRDGQIIARFVVSGIDMARGEDRLQSQFIGDATCEFNARSPYIRCAVNPCGPCEGCIDRH